MLWLYVVLLLCCLLCMGRISDHVAKNKQFSTFKKHRNFHILEEFLRPVCIYTVNLSKLHIIHNISRLQNLCFSRTLPSYIPHHSTQVSSRQVGTAATPACFFASNLSRTRFSRTTIFFSQLHTRCGLSKHDVHYGWKTWAEDVPSQVYHNIFIHT